MVMSCAAYNCRERHLKGSVLSFHSFPSDSELRNQWIKNMRRENFQPSKYSKLCSKHFEPDCFDMERFGNPCLLRGAVPTIFQFPDHLVKNVSSRKLSKTRNVPPATFSTQSNDFTSKQPPSSENTLDVTTGISDSDISKPKRKHYVGDYRENDMTSPNKAKKCLFMAQCTISSQRKRLKNLLRQNRRIRKRVNSLKSLLAHLQKESLINENAAEVLKVSIFKEEISETGPKEVCIMVKRFGIPSTKQASEGPSSKKRKRADIKPSSRRSTRSTKLSAESQKKRQKTDKDEREISSGGDSDQPSNVQRSENDGDFCVVCRKFVEQGTSLTLLTDTSKEPFHEKLTRLIAGKEGLSVKGDGVLCPVCTRLVNYMDRTEVELSMLKLGILNCMRKKQSNPQAQKCNADQSGPGVTGKDTESTVTAPSSEQMEEESAAVDHTHSINEAVMDPHHDHDYDERPVDYDERSVDYDDPDDPEPQREIPQRSSPNQQNPLPSKETTVKEKTCSNPVENKLMGKDSVACYKCNMCKFKTSFKSVIIFHRRQHMKTDLRCDSRNINIPQYKEKILSTMSPLHLRHKRIILPAGVLAMPSPPSSAADKGVKDRSSPSESVPDESEPHKTVITSLNETHIEILANKNLNETCDDSEVPKDVVETSDVM